MPRLLRAARKNTMGRAWCGHARPTTTLGSGKIWCGQILPLCSKKIISIHKIFKERKAS